MREARLTAATEDHALWFALGMTGGITATSLLHEAAHTVNSNTRAGNRRIQSGDSAAQLMAPHGTRSMPALILVASLLVLASCASPSASQRASASISVLDSSVVQPGPLIEVSVVDRIAIVNAAWQERTSIVADGAFIAAQGLFGITGLAPREDARWNQTVQGVIWGDERPFEQQPRFPARMRLWSVQRIDAATADSVVLTARLNYSPREHRESFTLSYREGRWGLRSLQIHGWSFY